MTFIGSTSGALLVQHVQSDILRQILPVLVIAIGLYFLLMPRLGEDDRQRRLYGCPACGRCRTRYAARSEIRRDALRRRPRASPAA
ncbi:hypothetical protein CDT93_20950 [Cronobacter sakazakii]|nr:hypothetical protein CDT93_20950 [Cronobacter sakazakii]